MKIKRVVIGLILVLSFFGEGILIADDCGQIQNWYLAGKRYFYSGDYRAAVKEFEKVIKIKPDYRVAAEYLKRAKDKFSDRPEKEAVFAEKEVLAKKESDIDKIKEGWRNWLEKEREKKGIKEAKKKEKARIKREKELAQRYGLDELEKMGQKAQEMIARAEEQGALEEKREREKWAEIEDLSSPQKEKAMARIYLAKANAAYRDGNYSEAIKEWEKVRASEPSNPIPQQCIESVRQKIEENKQSQLGNARQESIKQTKEAVKKYCKRGEYLYRHKDYEGSIKEFRKALAIDVNSKAAQQGILKAERVITVKASKLE